MKRNYQFFDCQDNQSLPFMNKLKDKLSQSWGSLGNISFNVSESTPGNYEIMFFPALREVLGGKEDGLRFFPGFNLNVGRFVRVFDKDHPTKVSLDCLSNMQVDHLVFAGKIDGHNVKVAVLTAPPPNLEPVEKVHEAGPNKGKIEPIAKA